MKKKEGGKELRKEREREREGDRKNERRKVGMKGFRILSAGSYWYVSEDDQRE